MDFGLVLIVLHVIGTILGVGAATMIEAHINQAYRDKLVSADERAILGIDYRMVRVGLVVCVFSGFGFLLLDKFEGETETLYDPLLWAKLSVIVIIAINTLLLQAHRINIYWGSVFSFVSWWSAVLFGLFMTQGFVFNFFGSGSEFVTGYASAMTTYAFMVVVGAVVLHYFRTKSLTLS